jgi:hypothetical protein
VLELPNEKHQLYLQKRKEKPRQSHPHHRYFELTSSQCISLSLSSSSDTKNQSVSLPLINIDTPNDEEDVIHFNINEYAQSIDDINNIDDPSVSNSSFHPYRITGKNYLTYSKYIDAFELFLSSIFLLASSLIKHIDILFNSIQLDKNKKKFTQLSKKIDRNLPIDSVSFPHSAYHLFGILHLFFFRLIFFLMN